MRDRPPSDVAPPPPEVTLLEPSERRAWTRARHAGAARGHSHATAGGRGDSRRAARRGPFRWWQFFWERAPRQLRFTRSGKVLVGLALAVGFASVNTGNNLLLLGWGLVLSSIVLSGVLSEGVLRNVSVGLTPPKQARAGAPALIGTELWNRSRWLPCFALDVSVSVSGPAAAHQAVAPFVLRLGPQERHAAHAEFTPEVRGRHVVSQARAETTYPFGFFAKSRRFISPIPIEVWAAPPAREVESLLGRIEQRLGEAPWPQPGAGEEFFSLRPFRAGDDVRRVHWRRSAKTGRPVVREMEANAGEDVILALALDGPPSPMSPMSSKSSQRLEQEEMRPRSRRTATTRAGAGGAGLREGIGAAALAGAEWQPASDASEHVIAVAGSVAEALLVQGRSVGILGPGLFVPPQAGAAFAWPILSALARLDVTAPLPKATLGPRTQVLVLAAPGPAAARAAASLPPASAVVVVAREAEGRATFAGKRGRP